MAVNKQLCRLEEIPDDGAIACPILTENAAVQPVPDSVILLRQNGQVFAYANACPHAGRRLDWAPGRFLIEDGSIICAAHGAMFQMDTGLCTAGPCRGASLTRVPVAIIDGQIILIETPERSESDIQR